MSYLLDPTVEPSRLVDSSSSLLEWAEECKSLLDELIALESERDLLDRRQLAVDLICDRFNADYGFWSWGQGYPETGRSVPVSIVQCGLDIASREAFFVLCMRDETDTWMRNPYIPLLEKQRQVCRARQHFWSDEVWQTSPLRALLVEKTGIAEWMTCVRYPTPLQWSCVTLLRREGAACLSVVASWTAYRVNQDRLQIKKQRDEITTQKDEITREKGISDDRLTLYRSTVSKMVNRAPRLLDGAPIGTGTRNELMGLLNDILNPSEDSDDSGIVGSAKKWGRMAIAIREGEIVLAETLALKKNSGDETTIKERFEKAIERFMESERIATEVYESPEPDRAKAASNLAFAIVRVAQTRFAADRSKWKECIPLHQKAIELKREALSSPILPGGNSKPLKESQLGDELVRYAEFLLNIGKTNPKFIEKARGYLKEAAELQLSALSAVVETPEIEEDARNRLALTYRRLASAALLMGDLPAVNQNYELSVSNYLALLEKSGYRYSFRQNLVGSANEYGDYLLKTHADPEKIEQQYRLAMDSLHNMVQTPEMISLEQNGLAIGYYRLGLACLRGGKDQEAESHFLHSAVLREKAYRDAVESLVSGSTMDTVLPQRIDWLLTQARSGMVADVTKTVGELGKRAMSEAPIQSVVSKSDIFLQCSAALGILAQTIPVRENPASSEKFQSQAIKSLGKAIDAGYRDINYLKSDADFEWLSQSDAMKPIEDKILALAASVPPPN